MTKDDLESNLERINSWIFNADQKISIFIALDGVLLGLFIPSFFKWVSKDLNKLNIFSIILLAYTSGFLLVSVLKLLFGLMPRLQKQTKEKSLIFFGDISNLTYDKFSKSVDKQSSKSFLDDLKEQIFNCSQIAAKKHSLFRDAIYYFLLAILICFLLIIYIKLRSTYGF